MAPGFPIYPVPDGAWDAQLRISTAENGTPIVGVDRTIKAPAAGKSLTLLGFTVVSGFSMLDLIPFVIRLRLGAKVLLALASQTPQTGPPEVQQVGGDAKWDGVVKGAANGALIARVDTAGGAALVPTDEFAFTINFLAWGLEA